MNTIYRHDWAITSRYHPVAMLFGFFFLVFFINFFFSSHSQFGQSIAHHKQQFHTKIKSIKSR